MPIAPKSVSGAGMLEDVEMLKEIATHSASHRDEARVLQILQTYCEQLGFALAPKLGASRYKCVDSVPSREIAALYRSAPDLTLNWQ
jgi:hypothetical protein